MCVKSHNRKIQMLDNRKSENAIKSNPEIDKSEKSNNPRNPENLNSGWGAALSAVLGN